MLQWCVRFALFAWEIPQNLLGLLLLSVHYARRNIAVINFEHERVFIEIKSIGAVSLGLFVFYTRRDNTFVPVGDENRDHEFGHTFQSRALGPLYLPIVGLASEARLLYAVGFKLLTGRRWPGYYDGFPEKAADELGDVDRKLRPSP